MVLLDLLDDLDLPMKRRGGEVSQSILWNAFSRNSNGRCMATAGQKSCSVSKLEISAEIRVLPEGVAILLYFVQLI